MAEGDVPDNAPESCPGTQSEQAGKSAACAGCPNQKICATAPKGPDPDLAAIADRMSSIKHKILVLSGKGGVGKSTFSSQLAYALAAQGKEVGLLDIDICGPSIPKMLGLEGEEIHHSNLGWSPVYVEDNLAVMSIGFMLPDPDEAVIWRGPRKNGLIKQFLKDVHWGELDYLVVDSPPGTSDEHITIAQCLQASAEDGAVIVTTPQEVSIIDVRKEINFCKKVGLPILGVVENMSGLLQPLPQVRFLLRPGTSGDDTQEITAEVQAKLEEVLRSHGVAAGSLEQVLVQTDVFHATKGGADFMCKQMGVPLLGKVPLDPALGLAAEEGRSLQDAMQDDVGQKPSLPALQQIVGRVIEACGNKGNGAVQVAQ